MTGILENVLRYAGDVGYVPLKGFLRPNKTPIAVVETELLWGYQLLEAPAASKPATLGDPRLKGRLCIDIKIKVGQKCEANLGFLVLAEH